MTHEPRPEVSILKDLLLAKKVLTINGNIRRHAVHCEQNIFQLFIMLEALEIPVSNMIQ